MVMINEDYDNTGLDAVHSGNCEKASHQIDTDDLCGLWLCIVINSNTTVDRVCVVNPRPNCTFKGHHTFDGQQSSCEVDGATG